MDGLLKTKKKDASGIPVFSLDNPELAVFIDREISLG